MMPIGQFICDGHLDGGGAVDREMWSAVLRNFILWSISSSVYVKKKFYKIISNLLIPTHWISFFLFKMTSWSHIWREKELGKFMTKYSLTLVKFPHIDNLEIGNAFIAIVSFNPLLAQQKQTCKKNNAVCWVGNSNWIESSLQLTTILQSELKNKFCTFLFSNICIDMHCLPGLVLKRDVSPPRRKRVVLKNKISNFAFSPQFLV